MSSFRRRMMMNSKKDDIGYLCFTFIESGKLILDYGKSVNISYIDISFNKKTWQRRSVSSFGSISNINVNAGSKVYIKGYGTSCVHSTDSIYVNFSSTAKHNLSGNIMSLLYDEEFKDKTSLPGDKTFSWLFKNDTGLVSCEDLILPATELRERCYYGMFQGCTSLTKPIKSLPATILKTYCYYYMFYGCSSLTSVPNMVVDTNGTKSLMSMFYNTAITDSSNVIINDLKDTSCKSMYSSCKSLLNGPIINAQILDTDSCNLMFNNTINIEYIKALFLDVDVNGSSAITNWLRYAKNDSGCIIVKHINAVWNDVGDSGVPTNWTMIYYNPNTDKYYLSDKTTECDDHGNVI